jgi:Sugar kinases, ribokinase family
MEKRPVIIGIGELLWDLLPTGKKVGGAPVNFVYHASGVGADSYAISAVGKDKPGDEILKVIERINIQHIIERVEYPTGTVRVEFNEGNPVYTITEEVAWDYIPLTNQMKELAKRADAVCLGTLAQRAETSRNTIRTLLKLVPDSAYRIFDINIRQHFYSKETIFSTLKSCNVFKINDDELRLLKELFGITALNEEEACRWFLENFGLQYLMLTAGADYSMVLTPDASSRIKTPKVKVVDTVGAGDSFTGAFISSILDGKTFEEAHRDAVELAAFVCMHAGAWPSESYEK